MSEKNQKKVLVTLPQDLYDVLKEQAAENRYSLAGYIRQLLRIHLREQTKK